MKVTVKFSRDEMADESPDLSYLEPQSWMGAEDKEANDARMDAYNRGDWHMIGIRAVAHIHVYNVSGGYTMYELTSPGLWGIESDSDESYLQEVFKEECSQLQADIVAMRDAEFKS